MKDRAGDFFEWISGAAIATYFALKVCERLLNPKTFSGWLSGNGRDLGAWIVAWWWLAIIVGVIGHWFDLWRLPRNEPLATYRKRRINP